MIWSKNVSYIKYCKMTILVVNGDEGPYQTLYKSLEIYSEICWLKLCEMSSTTDGNCASHLSKTIQYLILLKVLHDWVVNKMLQLE